LNKNNILDNVSALFKRAIDTLFLFNPEMTSLGILFGIIIDFIVNIFKPMLLNYSNIIDVTKLNTILFIVIGIFIFNIYSIMKRPKFPKNIEIALNLIIDAKSKKNLSQVQIRQMYLNLFHKILNETKML
jgi:hypothetical protein